MPTVPSSFVPQVGMAGEGSFVAYQAPSVMPMDEATSKQQQELGRAMIGTGNTMFRVGSAIQDDIDIARARQAKAEMDEAKAAIEEAKQQAKIAAQRQNDIDDAATKSADTALLRRMNTIRSDYMTLSGKDAEVNYQASQDAMTTAASEMSDQLGNDTQKQMFQQVAARNIMMFQGQMYDHRNKQAKEWAGNEAIARSDSLSDLAVVSYMNKDKVDASGVQIGLTQYNATLEKAIDEVRTAAQIKGIPEGSAQLRAMEQNVYDKVATGVVNDLLNARKYSEAEAFLDNHPVDPKVNATLRSSVDANRQRTTVEELTSNIINRSVIAAASDPKKYPDNPSENEAPADTLRDALDKAEQIEDPVMRRLVQSNVRTQFAQEDALIDQEYKTLIDNTEQYLAVPGNTVASLSPVQFGRLKPKDQERFLTGQRETNEVGTMEELARDPKKALDPEWVDANRLNMTSATYVKLRMAASKPQEIYDASVNADQLNKTLSDNGMWGLLENKETSLRVRENITTIIDQEQRKIKRPLNREEKQAIIDRELRNVATLDNAPWYQVGLGRGTQMPIVQMTPGELGGAYRIVETVDPMTGRVTTKEVPLLSKEQRKLLEKTLKEMGIPVNDATIANLLLKMNSR